MKIRLSFYGQVNAALNNKFPCYIFELTEKIDSNALNEAVLYAIDQHPVFHTKLVKEKKIYYLVDNELPPVIKLDNWDKDIQYGTKEWNYYPWMILAKGNKILFTCAHMLCDGTGAVEFLKTVLTKYLAVKGLISDGALDIIKRSDADKALSIENSYEKNAIENLKPPYKRREKKPGPIKKSLFRKTPDTEGIWRFRISQKDIVRLSNDTETTTFAVISAIVSQALQDVCKMEDGNIQVILAVNLRKMYNSKTDSAFVYSAPLNYDCRICRNKPLDFIATAFRSQLDLIIDKDYMDYILSENQKSMNLLLKHPIILLFAKLAFFNMLYSPKASIVYTHLTSLGISDEIRPYIKDYYISGASTATPLNVVLASTHNDEISITMGNSIKDDAYIKSIEKILTDHGINYKLQRNEWLPKFNYCT